jgi:hypothetical protein
MLATIKSKEELIGKSLIASITSTKSYFCTSKSKSEEATEK